jgi:hypothetical protein
VEEGEGEGEVENFTVAPSVPALTPLPEVLARAVLARERQREPLSPLSSPEVLGRKVLVRRLKAHLRHPA